MENEGFVGFLIGMCIATIVFLAAVSGAFWECMNSSPTGNTQSCIEACEERIEHFQKRKAIAEAVLMIEKGGK